MKLIRRVFSIWLLVLSIALHLFARAQDATQPPAFKKEEIEQLVAPIALYPDSLVAQILMASTYPLEVVEAARWVKANPNVKDKALEEAMEKQTWDPSVKSLTAFPQVLAMMNDKLDMTQKLGDAFLGQQKEVLDGHAGFAHQSAGGRQPQIEQGADGHRRRRKPARPSSRSSRPTHRRVYVPTYDSNRVYGPWPYPAIRRTTTTRRAMRRARRLSVSPSGVAMGALCGATATGAAGTSTSTSTSTTISTGPTSERQLEPQRRTSQGRAVP